MYKPHRKAALMVTKKLLRSNISRKALEQVLIAKKSYYAAKTRLRIKSLAQLRSVRTRKHLWVQHRLNGQFHVALVGRRS